MVKLQKWEKEDDEIKELQAQRINILRLHHLAGLNNTSYGCLTERQHPDLIKFDKETDNHISKIIRGES